MRTTRNALLTPALFALLTLLALVGAGCAGAPADTAGGAGAGTDQDQDQDQDQALAFAACMREQGVAAFPDPDASGELTIDAIANGSGLDTESAAFTQARTACKDLEPSGFTGDAVTPEQQDARLEFARCIRENGVADFPDPTPDTPLVDTNRIPSASTDAGMRALDAAMETCGDLAAVAIGEP